MSNETKIGILAVVAIALSFWGYKFIMGKNVLLDSNIYYVEYENVQMLQLGTPVYINGFSQGNVADIFLKEDDPHKVIIMIDMNDGVKIHKDAKVVIEAAGFMGGNNVLIRDNKPCNDANCAQSGDYLTGITLNLVASILGTEDMDKFSSELTNSLKEVINDQIGSESNSDIAVSIRELRATLTNLNSATSQLDALLARSSGKIDGTLANVQAITKNLDENKARINSILENVDNFSSELSQLELAETVEKINTTMGDLDKMLASTSETIGGVKTLVEKINSGEGSLGKLIKDDELYNNLDRMSQSVDSLASDFQTRPYRYVPFKSRKRVKRHDEKDAKEAAQGN